MLCGLLFFSKLNVRQCFELGGVAIKQWENWHAEHADIRFDIGNSCML